MVPPAEESFWTALGMDADDARLYQYLLAYGASAERAASAATSLTLEAVQKCMRKLAELGLVTPSLQGWVPKRPSSTLLHLVRERRAALSAGPDVVAGLDRLWGAGAIGHDSSDIFETLVGAERIGERLMELMRFARTTVDVIDAAPYVSPPSAQMTEEERSAQNRGVIFRVLVDSAALENDEHRADISRTAYEHQQVRVSTGLTTKLVLFDKKHALVPLDLQFTEPRAAVVSQPELVRVFAEHFEVLFALGSPLEPAQSMLDVSAAEHQLIGLLSTGVPDAIIARDMKVSERTLRRRISDLQDRFRVNSRFQLGRAVERAARDVPDAGSGATDRREA